MMAATERADSSMPARHRGKSASTPRGSSVPPTPGALVLQLVWSNTRSPEIDDVIVDALEAAGFTTLRQWGSLLSRGTVNFITSDHAEGIVELLDNREDMCVLVITSQDRHRTSIGSAGNLVELIRVSVPGSNDVLGAATSISVLVLVIAEQLWSEFIRIFKAPPLTVISSHGLSDNEIAKRITDAIEEACTLSEIST